MTGFLRHWVLVVLVGMVTVNSAFALSYSSVKDAVISSLGKGEKIYQNHIPMTPENRMILKNSIGWEPKKKSFKVYYAKDKGGEPFRYVFILSEALSYCGGLHKYSISISKEGRIEDVRVLELTCDRSYGINKRSFLRQFQSFDVENVSEKAKNYDAISGATLSTDLTRDMVQRSLALYSLLKAQK